MVADKFTLPASPVGIIESLTSGFEVVATHLYILLLPLAIDLFLWMGPRFTLRPFWAGLEQAFASAEGDNKDAMVQLVRILHAQAQAAPNRYLPVLLPPTLYGGRQSVSLPFDFKPLVIQTPFGVLIGVVLALLGGFVLCEIYLGWIAACVVGEPLSVWRAVRRYLSVAVQTMLAGTGIVLIGLASFFAITVVFVILQALGVDPSVAQSLFILFILIIMFMFVFPACIMLMFTIHSMFLNGRNIIAAMWDSIRVVQWNMLPTTILLILVVGIYLAMNTVWALADRGTWLALAAIGGNSFIAAGLIAATFVYFRDRYRYWREIREQLLAELERRRGQQDTNRQA